MRREQRRISWAAYVDLGAHIWDKMLQRTPTPTDSQTYNGMITHDKGIGLLWIAKPCLGTCSDTTAPTVTLQGFTPNAFYTVHWWHTCRAR